MRRDVIQKAIRNIVSAVEKTEIKMAIRSVASMSADQGPISADSLTNALTSFNNYSLQASNFGTAEKTVCRIMGIENLDSPNTWQRFMQNKTSQEDRQFVRAMLEKIEFVRRYLPSLVELIKQEHVSEVHNKDDDLPDQLKEKEILSVVIIEDTGTYSSPKRLAKVLESIEAFYEVISIINNLDENDLIVLAVDSGSDKSFDFLGVDKVISSVKDLIVSIWDKKVYYRHNQKGANIDLIAKALPVLDEISRLKESGALEPEQAKILSNKTIKAATDFVEAGATIPEIADEAFHEPRLLMKPAQKLLVAPKETESPSDDAIDLPQEDKAEKNNDVAEDNMVEEDVIEQLSKLSSKKRKKLLKILKSSKDD